jgi:hypothetical protein
MNRSTAAAREIPAFGNVNRSVHVDSVTRVRPRGCWPGVPRRLPQFAETGRGLSLDRPFCRLDHWDENFWTPSRHHARAQRIRPSSRRNRPGCPMRKWIGRETECCLSLTRRARAHRIRVIDPRPDREYADRERNPGRSWRLIACGRKKTVPVWLGRAWKTRIQLAARHDRRWWILLRDSLQSAPGDAGAAATRQYYRWPDPVEVGQAVDLA